jgi:hypothetical protein
VVTDDETPVTDELTELMDVVQLLLVLEREEEELECEIEDEALEVEVELVLVTELEELVWLVLDGSSTQ